MLNVVAQKIIKFQMWIKRTQQAVAYECDKDWKVNSRLCGHYNESEMN